ncbi:MAG: autotransporter-associated beta strand repeat-containing protein [Prevotella sp.]|nr:autotransporter-associated beta strand repeat-containing protein [Prevotella sp.]
MKKKALLILMAFVALAMQAQRTTDKLDRGLVAVPGSSGGNLVSWRIFAEEYYDVAYNLYCNGEKLNDKPLQVSNFRHASGNTSSRYQVAAVVRGVEQEKSEAVTRWNSGYLQFAVKPVTARDGSDMTADCNINDIALADLTGDGVSEFIMKRNYGADSDATGVYPVSNKTRYNHIEVYNIKGDRLWWIDLGPNMVSGPDEQYDAVGYDWDGDGKAEVLMRGADNMIIHHPDGTTTEIGNMNVNTRNDVRHDDANGAYTHTGAEYLLYLEGATGKPYEIGPNGEKWMTYPLPRGNASDWGDSYGHRCTKHYFGAPFLDGRKPFIYLGRGCYTRHMMKTYSVDPETHKLTLYWSWENNNGWSDPWYGNGYHNFGIADVDWDGRDEIVFGSMVIDDNGKGLSTTGLGHGDAQHCSDFDPYRHGQEIFACNEDEPAMNYRDATTSKIYYRLQSTSDDGRALCGNFSNDYPGAIGHSSQSGTVSCVTDKVLSGAPSGFTNNWRIYWDDDLLEEGLDGASSREGAARVFKANGSVVFTADGTANCNWTKNTPSAVGDIFGDWREEIVVRSSDNKYVRIYTTNIYTPWRNYTLWHDHQYRQGMVWETVGYNQPPHTSYFLGELENITVAPPPLTMSGRTEIANNGTISAANNDQHVIVCETNDTKITVAEGAQPFVATFNVPSWVQGTNSNSTTNPVIRYTYYTCTVDGGAFGGDMRLVKQGDGVLSLPNVVQTYSGPTDVWAGVLNFDGTLQNSNLWLNRFAELNSNGGKFRNITMDYDSKLRPGRADNMGSITADTLNLGFGSRVIFDIYNDGLKADQLNVKVLTIETKNWQNGPKYSTPIFEFNSVRNAGDDMATGRYFIGAVEEVKGNLSDIRIEGLGNGHKSQLLVEDGKLYLEISGMRDATTITWNGNESSTWDLATSQNFTNNDDPTIDNETFVSGDKVIFNDEAQQFNVVLEGDLEADSVIVDNTNAYTFSGTGAITGTTTLVKRGTGTLTINTDNSYTGGTRLSGGTTVVSSLSNSTQAVGNLGAVANVNTKFVMENGAILRTSQAITQGSVMRMEGPLGGVVNHSADFIIDKAVSGTKLTKRGAGWMKLNVGNSGLDTLDVAAGTVQCINSNIPAKSVVYEGGTLRENTGTSYAVIVPKGKVGTWYLANRSTYTNKITGEGTLTIYCVTEKGSNYYATRTPVQCNFTDFAGTIKPTSSLDDPSLLRFTLNTTGSAPKATFDIPAGAEVQNSGKTFTIGKVTGSGNLGGSCTFSNGTSVGANTWRVGNDESFTFDGKVTSNANFAKIGTGKMQVKGVWTNTGTVKVTEGELALSTTAELGTGALTVEKDGLLTGSSASSTTLKNSSFTINGTLQPGASKSSTSGSLNFGSKNVTFAKGSTYVVGASRCASRTNAGCANIKGVKRLTMNGTVSVFLSVSHTLAAGDSIRIWEAETFSGTPVYDLPDLGNGLAWDTSRISEGLLFVTASDGIDAVLGEMREQGCDVYNASGQLVRRNARTLDGLKPGIYFVRGQKINVR